MINMRARIINDIVQQGYIYWRYTLGDNPIPGLSHKEQIRIQRWSAEYYSVGRELMGIKEEDQNY